MAQGGIGLCTRRSHRESLQPTIDLAWQGMLLQPITLPEKGLIEEHDAANEDRRHECCCKRPVLKVDDGQRCTRSVQGPHACEGQHCYCCMLCPVQTPIQQSYISFKL